MSVIATAPRVDWDATPYPLLRCGECDKRHAFLFTLPSLNGIPPFYLILDDGFGDLEDRSGRWAFTSAARERVKYERPPGKRGRAAYAVEHPDQALGEYHPVVLQFPATIVCPKCGAQNVFAPRPLRMMETMPDPERAIAWLGNCDREGAFRALRLYSIVAAPGGRIDFVHPLLNPVH